MDGILFGIGSIPLSVNSHNKEKPYIATLKRLYELNLGAFELPFGNFINMSANTALEFEIANTNISKKEGTMKLAISSHAPYYINLNSEDEKILESSVLRIINSIKITAIAGGNRVVFHPGFYQKISKPDSLKRIRIQIEKILNLIDENIGTKLYIETTGKETQFGTIEELVTIAKQLGERVGVCVDFAHLHARFNGKFNTYDEFRKIIEYMLSNLSDPFHIHYSGISYSQKGEKSHLPLKESDSDYSSLMKALKKMSVKGILICESPQLEYDALLLKETYESI